MKAEKELPRFHVKSGLLVSKKLKEQKQQLEQQIKAAAGDEEKVKELEKKLSQIEGELNQKDNDTYRRQKAIAATSGTSAPTGASFDIEA